MEPPTGTESARLVSPRGGRADGSLRLKSLFTGSQDPSALPAPPVPAPHCCCSPPTPSPGQGRLQAHQQLSVACAVCCLFMVGEVIGGYLAHSLAIMTDAAHLLTDMGSMSVSLFSLWVSNRPPTKTMTFGWHRSETLGALASVLSIWVVTAALVYLAAARIISNDYEIEARAMLATSACAVGVNLVMAYILHQAPAGHGHGTGAYEQLESSVACQPSHGPLPGSTSVRAAFVHVVGDLLQSVSVLVAATIIYFKPQCKIADPISTLFFSVFVLGSTITILRDVFRVLMEGGAAPGGNCRLSPLSGPPCLRPPTCCYIGPGLALAPAPCVRAGQCFRSQHLLYPPHGCRALSWDSNSSAASQGGWTHGLACGAQGLPGIFHSLLCHSF
ncbi:zinc transporter 3 isoform X2 [Corvus kubaryi]|uniref:zinc transporter 3 isoform X2 n=1 Tax=Corvus kubaryi TaxID=68294 RepID=UPI001C05AE74|nr:zinc transporter 3 isoform X2 [Corvus kubaryi]